MPKEQFSDQMPVPAQRWWIWAQNLLTVLALLAAPFFLRQKVSEIPTILGGIMFAVGALVGIRGVRDLGRNRTPHPAPLPEGRFVQTGIYARIRHPLYTSLALVTFGWSMLWNSPPAFLASIGLSLLLDRKARVEERLLVERFPDYTQYSKRVRKFLPGIY